MVAAVLLGSVAGMAAVSTPIAITAAATPVPPISSKETGIKFTSKTVVINRATVAKYLLGVAPDGTFKFKSSTGPLTKLAAGKVMLLQGADALLVTSITHSKQNLLVHTKTAAISDLISSGHITFSGAPNFAKAMLRPIAQPKSTKAAARFAPPTYPYVGSAPHVLTPRRGAPPSFSAQGSTGLYGYSLTFTPSSPTRLDVSGTLCYISFSVCGNGPSNGLSAEVNLSGYVDAGDASGGISVNGGKVTNSSISLKALAAHAHLTYTITRGDGSNANGSPPVLRVPIGIDYTIPGEIPIYLKLQLALLLNLGVSSKNAVIHGGVNVSTTGSDSVTQQGAQLSDSESGASLQGKVLDQSNGGVPASESLASSGVVVGLQFPKLGFGLGYTSVNGIAYVDLISVLAQTTGASIAGMFCSSYDAFLTVQAGVEAQIGLGKLGLSLASQPKTLYKTELKTHDPGCPQT
jgi:hypothetical protein